MSQGPPRTRAGYRNPDVYRCGGYQVTGCRMPEVSREAVDKAVYAYFEQVGLDVEATREALSEGRDRKLAEVRSLLSQAEAEAQRARERLARVRRDYQDGRLDADDWREQRRELEGEREAAEAEVARLREQEQEVSDWAQAIDAERETLARLAEIRTAIAGEVASAEGVEAVRAALARTFERFIFHCVGSPKAPERAHMELASVTGYVIEPVIREQREGEYPDLLPAREPLVQAPNKFSQGVGYRLYRHSGRPPRSCPHDLSWVGGAGPREAGGPRGPHPRLRVGSQGGMPTRVAPGGGTGRGRAS